MQTVCVGSPDDGRGREASPIVDLFFFKLPISHGCGMTRAVVWPWERAAEEAGSRVGLPREHPVYRGGPRCSEEHS